MSQCRICGRPLSNPASIAAGVGPVCGSRNYRGRIMSRYGASGGWSEIEEWEKVNSPCYSCKSFEFPVKGQEVKKGTGYQVTMHGQDKVFDDKNSIGGWCKALHYLCDGNLTKPNMLCRGKWFHARKTEAEQPEVGLLIGENGQTELFKI